MLETFSTQKPSHALGNSERIRMKFGSYGIEVLENSPGIRVSSLYSTDGGIRINRTFAVVAYPEVIEPAFKMEHEAIINGQSIGILFRDNGWAIDKRHQYFAEIEIPTKLFSEAPHSGITKSAIQVYSLIIKKDGAEFDYASIAEVHHPDFLRLEDLAAIYGPEFENHRHKKAQITAFLDIAESRILAL